MMLESRMDHQIILKEAVSQGWPLPTEAACEGIARATRRLRRAGIRVEKIGACFDGGAALWALGEGGYLGLECHNDEWLHFVVKETWLGCFVEAGLPIDQLEAVVSEAIGFLRGELPPERVGSSLPGYERKARDHRESAHSDAAPYDPDLA
jgi:hypothetical protein